VGTDTFGDKYIRDSEILYEVHDRDLVSQGASYPIPDLPIPDFPVSLFPDQETGEEK
jgi:hypothetical protein